MSERLKIFLSVMAILYVIAHLVKYYNMILG